ncbi:hypothetical protein QEN19_001928 [Hanseniaspora menglaensis]
MSNENSHIPNGTSGNTTKKIFFNELNEPYEKTIDSSKGNHGFAAVNRTPEQRSHNRRPSQQYMQQLQHNQYQPQVSVPATPRMLSNSSRHSSIKKYAPQTPPHNGQVISQHHTLLNSTQASNAHNQSNYYTNYSSSGDTANGRIILSPNDSLRREKANFRNDYDNAMNMGSPPSGRGASYDRRRQERSFDKFGHEITENSYKAQNGVRSIPIIKISNHSNEEKVKTQHIDDQKGFDFIQAYEQDHVNDNILMPAAALSNNQGAHPAVVKTLNSDNHENSKITVVESGKKYKEFHRKTIGDWEFIQNIGSGSMGKVKVAKNIKTEDLCAVKIVTRAVKTFLYKCEKDPKFKNSLSKEEYKERILKENSRDKRTIREGGMGQVFYHPNICRLFHIWSLTTHYYMLFEYIQGGQLLDYIIQHGSLKEHRVRKFTRGIASAIKYLHGHNIVHRDLKIENILISDSGDIKIIDFGLSNFYNVNSELKTFCGSLYFAAPELLKAEPYIGPEVDIWAFGIVMFVLLCGKVPFDNDRSDVLHKLIKEGNVDYPSYLSVNVKSLLKRMIIVDRNMRYSIDDIINHPWMNEGYDYNVLSHIPARKPLTDIDINVCQEMVNLCFFDDPQSLYESLNEVIQSDEYIYLARKHFQMFGNDFPKSGDDDPLLGFHPNISLYYLVSEFTDRKDSSNLSNIQLASQSRNKTGLNDSFAVPKRDYKTPTPKDIDQNVSYKIAYQSNDENKQDDAQMSLIPDYKNTIRKPVKSQEQSKVNENVISKDETVESQFFGLQAPVQPIYKPKVIENQGVEFEQNKQQQPNQERFGFGSLFRRFSQNKRKPSNPVSTTSDFDDKPWKKNHKRTVSEGIPSQHRKDENFKGNDKLPALPTNADFLLKREQQRYNSVNDAGTILASKDLLAVPAADKFRNLEDSNIDNQSIISKRTMHPNARAKSVGGNVAMNFIRHDSDSLNKGFNKDKTVDQILKEAATADKNTMLSIEYPKIFFLKNFFSVQTTSFLPLPVVRYEIIKTLNHMNIKYKEVPGAFVCTQDNQNLIKEMASQNDTLDDITSAYYDDDEGKNVLSQNDTGKNNLSRRGSVMRKAYKQQIPQTPNIFSNGTYSSVVNTPRSPHAGDISMDYDDTIDYSDENGERLSNNLEAMNIDGHSAYIKSSKSRVMITDDNKYSSSINEKSKVVFEIHIVKVPVIGTAGVHFKKISGNTWNYKTLASSILDELKL